MSFTTLDARRLLCPLPVIRTQDAVAELNPGDSLQILCTDPGVIHDIPVWCRLHGHQVCAVNEQDDEIAITIRVGSSST